MSANFKRFVAGPFKYCFVDFDGTIRASGTEGYAPDVPSKVQVFPWVPARLAEARQKGYIIVGITNQSFLTQKIGEAAVQAVCEETVRQAGLIFPYFFAKTRPEAKPNTFMLDQAVLKYGEADKATSIMIGDDLEKDGGVAKNFGIRHMSPQEFEQNGVP